MTAAVALCLVTIAPLGANEDASVWHDSFASAQAAAIESGRPLLVNFGGPGCGPCEKMKTETLADDAVVAVMREQFEAAHVDAAVQTDIATRFLVNQFPTVKFMHADETVILDHRGFVAADEFVKVMEQAAEGHAILVRTRLLAEEAGEDAAAEAALGVAQGFFSVRQYQSAAQWARRALDGLPADATDLRASASFVLGVAFAESGEPGAAVEPLQTALSLEPDAPWVWQARLNLGYAWLQTDEREKGGELLREVAASEEADAEFRREALLLLRWVGLDTP